MKASPPNPRKVLFDESGSPHHRMFVKGCVSCFGDSYQATVREVIAGSEGGLDREILFRNVAKVMSSFKMTRQGPFKGVKVDGNVQDPSGQIGRC